MLPKSPVLRAALLLAACSILGGLSSVRTTAGTEGFDAYPLGMLALVLLQVRGRTQVAVAVAAVVVTAGTMWTLGQSLVESIGYSAGGVLAAYVALMLLRAHSGRYHLRSESDLLRILVASLTGAIIVSAAAFVSGSLVGVQDMGSLLLASFINEVASLVLWMPLMMPRRADPALAGGAERFLQWTVLVGVCLVVFTADGSPAFTYLAVVVLGWAGLRNSLIETQFQLIVVRLIAITATTHGLGPFSETAHAQDLPPDLSIVFVQLFLITITVGVVALSLSSTRTRLVAHQETLARAAAEADNKLRPMAAALAAERTALKELQEVDRVRDAVISTVSHELRTPVTNIIGYAELLDDGDYGHLNRLQSGAMHRIGENGRRLLSLIDDLLTLSRLRSEQMVVRKEPVDLVEVIRAAETVMSPRVRQADLDLELDLAQDSVVISADAEKIERVVLNLLSNAVKFTPHPGRVTVALRCDERRAVMTVEDTGYGISVADQGRLFAQFFRTADAQDRHIQGTGLGLSIVRAIIEGHDGTIEVESTLGVGTTFTVALPL